MYTLYVQEKSSRGSRGDDYNDHDNQAKKTKGREGGGGGSGLAKDSEAREIVSLAGHHDIEITYRTKHDLNLLSD
ncbi:MAG: hypothetical protein AAF327_23040, partial [Cyanobacteria bacterium P01_A01_bin.37]